MLLNYFINLVKFKKVPLEKKVKRLIIHSGGSNINVIIWNNTFFLFWMDNLVMKQIIHINDFQWI